MENDDLKNQWDQPSTAIILIQYWLTEWLLFMQPLYCKDTKREGDPVLVLIPLIKEVRELSHKGRHKKDVLVVWGECVEELCAQLPITGNKLHQN